MSWELMAAMAAITTTAAFYVAWPLLAGNSRPEEFFGDEPSATDLQQPELRPDAVYSPDEELELDPTTRRLSHDSIELDVEQEIEAFRRLSRERGAPDAAHRAPSADPEWEAPASCPACGRPVKDREATFCSRCGASLRQPGGPRGRSRHTEDEDGGTRGN